MQTTTTDIEPINRNMLKLARPMILFFILLNAMLITGKSFLVRKGIDQDVVIIGNLLLFTVTIVTYIISYRSLFAKNPNVFIRAMYGGFVIKFFVIAIAAFIYIMSAKKEVNKTALFICMGLYLLYTVMEVTALFRVLKSKKHG
ncbi:MAG: hypothetical protein EOO00_03765 [Chitinophagaceae bacterium]|nr:MAG: hypothetical protein EOO00_03765 [Chitinophagaceae bacterium]